jgi:hypothetical protein
MHIQHEHTHTRTWSGSTYSCHAGLLRGSRHSHHISARGLSHICARDCPTSAPGTVPHLRRDCPTSAPRLAHICAATGPHLRRDCPTSAPGLAHICAATVPHLRRDCPTSAPRLPRSLIGIWPAATRLARRSRFGTPSPRFTCGSRSSRRDRPSRTTYDRGKRNACVCVRVCVDVPVRARD